MMKVGYTTLDDHAKEVYGSRISLQADHKDLNIFKKWTYGYNLKPHLKTVNL